jgi:hypothetical protein
MNNNIKTLSILIFILLQSSGMYGATYYVSPAGNDNNPGSREAPWQTIQKGCDMAVAGDTVIIRDGYYRINQEIRPRHSGTPGNWITYMVLPGEKAVVDAEGFVSADDQGTYPSRRGLGSFHIQEASYIRVIGLQVRNSRSAGFIVRGPS